MVRNVAGYSNLDTMANDDQAEGGKMEAWGYREMGEWRIRLGFRNATPALLVSFDHLDLLSYRYLVRPAESNQRLSLEDTPGRQ